MKETLLRLTSFFRTRFFWINLILLLIVLGIIAFALSSYMTSYTRHGESVMVPDLRGQTVDQVDAYLSENKLNYLVYDSTYVVGKKALEVLEQDPPAGSKVKEQRRIYLTVNAQDAPEVKLPNLKDASLKDARLQLENKGLRMGKIIYRPHIWNVVIEMRYEDKVVKPGFQLKKGSKVDIIVGDGKGVNTFTVQSFEGLSFDEASAAIQLVGLKLGNVNRDLLRGGTKGYVYRQYPPAGSKVGKREKIDIWLTPVSADGADGNLDSGGANQKPSNSRPKKDKIFNFNDKEMLKDVLKKGGNR